MDKQDFVDLATAIETTTANWSTFNSVDLLKSLKIEDMTVGLRNVSIDRISILSERSWLLVVPEVNAVAVVEMNSRNWHINIWLFGRTCQLTNEIASGNSQLLWMAWHAQPRPCDVSTRISREQFRRAVRWRAEALTMVGFMPAKMNLDPLSIALPLIFNHALYARGATGAPQLSREPGVQVATVELTDDEETGKAFYRFTGVWFERDFHVLVNEQACTVSVWGGDRGGKWFTTIPVPSPVVDLASAELCAIAGIRNMLRRSPELGSLDEIFEKIY